MVTSTKDNEVTRAARRRDANYRAGAPAAISVKTVAGAPSLQYPSTKKLRPVGGACSSDALVTDPVDSARLHSIAKYGSR